MEEKRINSVGETADTIGGGENLETPHKRRVRYKGTHPRSYKEKYKELQPEKYGDTIAKVISKGSTPAGMHISIMVKEILDFLNIQPGQTGLDATLGYGGHTSYMLACLKGEGHMYALDVDTIEMEKTRKRLADKGFGPDILTIKHLNFANIDQVAEEAARELEKQTLEQEAEVQETEAQEAGAQEAETQDVETRETIEAPVPSAPAPQPQTRSKTSQPEEIPLGNPEELERLDQEEERWGPDELWNRFRKHYPKMQAFDSPGTVEILSIRPQDIGLLPRENWGYGNNSFLLHGYYNYRYLIFARVGDEKHARSRYILGVPGHYFSNEKYMASMFGFPHFVLAKTQPAQDGRFGYWYADVRMENVE